MAAEMGVFLKGLTAAKLVIDMSIRAYEWAERAAKGSKARDERQAIYLLRNAGVLVAALRALDNTFQEVITELRFFRPNWPPRRREQLMRRVSNLARQEMILPVIRQSLEELRETAGPGVANERIDPALIQTLIDAGSSVVASVGRSLYTPFPGDVELHVFLQEMEHAQTAEQVTDLVQKSETILGVINRRELADAERALGRLQAQIAREYPGLPPLDWIHLRQQV